jgi:hypothetical protein
MPPHQSVEWARKQNSESEVASFEGAVWTLLCPPAASAPQRLLPCAPPTDFFGWLPACPHARVPSNEPSRQRRSRSLNFLWAEPLATNLTFTLLRPTHLTLPAAHAPHPHSKLPPCLPARLPGGEHAFPPARLSQMLGVDIRVHGLGFMGGVRGPRFRV